MIEKNADGLYEVVIDDNAYQFEKWGAEESVETLLKLSKIIGKPIALIVGGLFGGDSDDKLFDEGKGIMDKKVNPDIIAQAVEALTMNLDEKSAISMIKKFSSHKVLCDGKPINFNNHYSDRLDLLFKVVKAGLEVQYGNFIGALLTVTPGAVKRMGVVNRAM